MADLFGIGTLISGALGFGASIYNTNKQEEANKRNIEMQKQINAQNIAAQKAINQQNIDYMRSMTQSQWERDDNAYQRQVADLEAAGLSPLAATASGNMNSSSVASPNLHAATQYPSHYQAPQFDINFLINSATKFADMYEKHNENLSKQNYRTTVLSQKADELLLKWQSLEDLNNYRDKSLVQQDEHFIKSFELQSKTFEQIKLDQDSKRELESFCRKNQMIYDSLKTSLPDKNLPHTMFHISDSESLSKYETAMQIYNSKFNEYLSQLEKSPKYIANASNAGKGGTAGISGSGLGLNVGANVNSGSYHAEAKDENTIFSESWIAYCMKNGIKYPVPVFLYK